MDDRSDVPPPPAPIDYASPSTSRQMRRSKVWVYVLTSAFVFALLSSIFLPSTRPARPQAMVIACQANIRALAQSVQYYAADHGGTYPDTVTILYPTYCRNADPRIFLCPACTDTPAQGATTRAVVTELTAGRHLSYVYSGAGLTRATAKASTVILFEWPGNHADSKPAGINVVFGDGRAQWVTDYRPILDAYAAGVTPIIYPPKPATAPTSQASGGAGQ